MSAAYLAGGRCPMHAAWSSGAKEVLGDYAASVEPWASAPHREVLEIMGWLFVLQVWHGACWNRIDTPNASEGGDLRKTRHECFVNNCSNRWVELDILSTQKSLFQSEFPHLRIVPLISTIKNTYHMLNSLFSRFKVKLHILWNPLLFRDNWNSTSYETRIPSPCPGSQGTRQGAVHSGPRFPERVHDF